MGKSEFCFQFFCSYLNISKASNELVKEFYLYYFVWINFLYNNERASNKSHFFRSSLISWLWLAHLRKIHTKSAIDQSFPTGKYQSPNSKVRKFNFIVPIQRRPEIEIIIYVKGPMCKQKPQTKINKLWKYGNNIKIGFMVGPKRSNVFFNSAIFIIFIYAFWFAFVRRVFIASVLFHASKLTNYSSYSRFLCSKVITAQLQIQRWTHKIRQRIIIHRLTLNEPTENNLLHRNEKLRTKHRTKCTTKRKNQTKIFTFCLCLHFTFSQE